MELVVILPVVFTTSSEAREDVEERRRFMIDEAKVVVQESLRFTLSKDSRGLFFLVLALRLSTICMHVGSSE